MNCCPSGACGGPEDAKTASTREFFSKEAAKYARRFERRGPDAAQRGMLKLLETDELEGRSVLDIGCGAGPMHVSLLVRGAGRAFGVDIAPAMIAQARRMATQSGFGERVEYRDGDFVQLAAQIPTHQITVLDKVVCCYEDIDAIVDRSVEKTEQTYVLSYPRAHVTLMMRLSSWLSKRLFGGFHPFVHDWGRLDQRILSHGFQRRRQANTLNWQIRLYGRLPVA